MWACILKKAIFLLSSQRPPQKALEASGEAEVTLTPSSS
jgi:hypothetical protein